MGRPQTRTSNRQTGVAGAGGRSSAGGRGSGSPSPGAPRNHVEADTPAAAGPTKLNLRPPSPSPIKRGRGRPKRPVSAGSNESNSNIDDSRGGRDIADNGFAQWGGYMAAKKQKLDKQFNESTNGLERLGSTRSSKTPAKQIFKGVSIYINGYTNPPEPELRELFTRHGGRYVQYPTASTTFVIATNLAAAKKRMFATKAVRPDWITDSIYAGSKLDTRQYMLYDLNKENKQQTLTQALKLSPKAKTSPSPSDVDKMKLKKLIVSIPRVDEMGGKNRKLQDAEMSLVEGPKPLIAKDLPAPKPAAVKNMEPAETSGADKSEVSTSSDSQIIEVAVPSPDPEPEQKSPQKNGPAPVSQEDQNSDDSDEVTIIESTPSPPRSRASFENAQAKQRSVTETNSTSSLHSEGSVAGSTTTSPRRQGTGKMKTAAEEGFLQDFYNNSRLHLISTLKKERQQNVGEWRANLGSHKFLLAEKYKQLIQESGSFSDPASNHVQNRAAILFHIDLDCFFVAVARLSRPHLQDKPVVITHSKGTDSKSDIACASYEARDKGISAGMWLHQAKELCPEVVAVPYEFDEYSRVSKQFYETVASLTLEMEAISCDEMLVNVSKLVEPTDDGLNSDPLQLARFLIKEIEARAGIKASIGIGCNRLLAKLATRVAKDNKSGCHFMGQGEGQKYIRQLPIRKLHGVGWATSEKLEALNVKTGSDLEKLSLQELKREFGEKTGQKMHSICRGIDDDTINVDCAKAKSISAGCSFGVRLANNSECERFLKEVSEEAANRANTARCYCNRMTLTLWIARKGYEKETVKPGGHGIADVHTKSQSFKQKTRDSNVLAASTLELARTIMRGVVPPEHIRGVSISLDGLVYESDLTEKERKSHQPTLFSQFKKVEVTKSASHKPTPRTSTEPSSSGERDSAISENGGSNSGPAKPDKTLSLLRTFIPDSKPGPKSRKALPPDTNNTDEHSSTAQWVEASAPINPYEDVQQLDPTYLAALPADVRAEVELDFQKAKHSKTGALESGDTAGCSSKVLKPKISPHRPFLKRSPIRGKKKFSPKKKLKFSPRKQPSSGSSSNTLRSYFKSVSRAMKSPSVSPIKRTDSGINGNSFPRKTSTQKSGAVQPSISLSNVRGGNRLTPGSGSDLLVVPESPEPELDQELQLLLETSPTKKTPIEVEQMVLSFNEDSKGIPSDINGNSSGNKEGGSSTDNECGQRLLHSARPKTLNIPQNNSSGGHSPRPTTSSRVRNDSGGDDLAIQAAILKSYGHEGDVDGYDFGGDHSFTGDVPCPGDNLSTANNLDSDRDDDFDEYDLNLNPTYADHEIELPPLNGETDIDKVHETIRMGISDRIPTEDDAECLMTYFRDLSATFLAETCNSLRFLQALRVELVKKGGEGADEWSSIFDTIIKQTQEWIQEDYGGAFSC